MLAPKASGCSGLFLVYQKLVILGVREALLNARPVAHGPSNLLMFVTQELVDRKILRKKFHKEFFFFFVKSLVKACKRCLIHCQCSKLRVYMHVNYCIQM